MCNMKLTMRAGGVAPCLSTWLTGGILGSIMCCWEWNLGCNGAYP